jgi:hypothetical protein
MFETKNLSTQCSFEYRKLHYNLFKQHSETWNCSAQIYSPNSVNLVCPNGIRFLKVFPSHVILTSLFEYSIFMVYPSSTNRSMHFGRLPELIRWFMSETNKVTSITTNLNLFSRVSLAELI